MPCAIMRGREPAGSVQHAHRFFARACASVFPKQERRQIQRTDEMFQQNHPHRFLAKYHQKAACTKLSSQGSIVTDPNYLLKCWADHGQNALQMSPSKLHKIRLVNMRLNQSAVVTISWNLRLMSRRLSLLFAASREIELVELIYLS